MEADLDLACVYWGEKGMYREGFSEEVMPELRSEDYYLFMSLFLYYNIFFTMRTYDLLHNEAIGFMKPF